MPRPPCRSAVRVPVRVKNTSSRLGRCRDSSSTRMPAACSRDTAIGRISSLSTLTVSRSRPSGSGRGAGQLGEQPAQRVQMGRVGRADREPLAADDALEAVRGVVGDDAAAVDDGDLVGERVGLLEVLRREQHGRAVGDEAGGRRPTCPRAWPGRARWSARRGRSPTAARRARRRGRGGGACRRSRSWPRRPAASVRSNQSSSSRARARASRCRQVEQLADHDEVLHAGQVLVDRGVLPGQADRAAHLLGVADHVVAADPGRAGVGAQQRGQDADGGGLAGAVRARGRRARCPGARPGRSRRGPGCSPKRLVSPSASMA